MDVVEYNPLYAKLYQNILSCPAERCKSTVFFNG
jgi:hypothetical protein